MIDSANADQTSTDLSRSSSIGAATVAGYVIVSADGMLADAQGAMPESLKFPADQTFFNDALDQAALIVHGRNSFEDQPNSPKRKRVIATRRIDALAPDPSNPNAMLWNPQGASFDLACARAGYIDGAIAIIGGPDIFSLFLDRYDVFWLSQALDLRLPGGRPAFAGFSGHLPDEILAMHGLKSSNRRMLDEQNNVMLTAWRRG